MTLGGSLTLRGWLLDALTPGEDRPRMTRPTRQAAIPRSLILSPPPGISTEWLQAFSFFGQPINGVDA